MRLTLCSVFQNHLFLAAHLHVAQDPTTWTYLPSCDGQFMRQLDWTAGCPDTWLNMIPGCVDEGVLGY